MKLDETVTCGSLEGCVGASCYSLRVPSGFGRRTGFDVNTGRIFHRMYCQGLALCSHWHTWDGVMSYVPGGEVLRVGFELIQF